MHISQETSAQTQARLARVIREAEFAVHDGAHAFVESPRDRFPHDLLGTALAFVRDREVWSALVPVATPSPDAFAVFSFHFTPGLDNSGFVGWLASHLKAVTGTGVLVVCGQNSRKGGIFDYWGAPLPVASRVVAEIRRLRGQPEGGPAT